MKECAWRAFGYSLGYRSFSCDLKAVLAEVILPNWLPVEAGTADAWIEIRGLDIYDDGIYWTTASDHQQLAHRVQQLTQMKLTWGSPDAVFLHCAVVRVEDSAWCIPGDSKAGKSTLVKALCSRGALFYSDEYAVLDSDGLVHSYPRPLWTRLSRRQREMTTPEELGWHLGLGPVAVSKVLLCPYRRDARWQPQSLTAQETARETSPFLKVSPERRSAAVERLELSFSRAQCLKGERPDSEIFLSAIWE